MKKIISILILATLCFSQTEDWIYYNYMTEYDWVQFAGPSMEYSVARINSYSSENEIILEGHQYYDISGDGSQLLCFDYENQTSNPCIYNIETTEKNCSTSDIFALKAKFTIDANEVLYLSGDQSASSLALYKYSFMDSSVSLISDSLSMGIDNMTLSPDREKVVYFKLTEDENSEDYLMNYDVIITHIESGETSILTTIPYLDFNNVGIWNNSPYWSDNGFIYLTFLDENNCNQLFAIHSTIGYVMQLTNNACGGIENILYCFSSILETKETDLDKFVYSFCDDLNGTFGNQIYDINSGESSYLGSFNGDNYISIAMSQSWSPDRTKVVFSEWVHGGLVIVPGPMRIYNTLTDSITVLGGAFNSDEGATYPAASPIMWLEDSLAGDVNSDGIVNVLDIVQTVNLVLTNEYEENGDLNGDGIVNILDIVALVQVILSN